MQNSTKGTRRLKKAQRHARLLGISAENMLARKAKNTVNGFTSGEAPRNNTTLAKGRNDLKVVPDVERKTSAPTSSGDLSSRIKDLLRIAQDQGYLTYDDINDVLPDDVITAEALDDVYTKLRKLNVQIVDSAEAFRKPQQPEPQEEEE